MCKKLIYKIINLQVFIRFLLTNKKERIFKQIFSLFFTRSYNYVLLISIEKHYFNVIRFHFFSTL